MSSKRQRVSGSTSKASKVYDKHRFINRAASDNYYSFLTGRELIPEWGLAPHKTQDGDIVVMIKEHRFENFTQKSEAAVVNIVREFYTNVKETGSHVIQVRGKPVSFDKATINAYYCIKDIEHKDEFAEYRDGDFNWYKVCKSLCRPLTFWTLKGDYTLHFSLNELSRYVTT